MKATTKKPFATLSKKYKRGVVFYGEQRLKTLINVLNKKDTVIYLVEDQEMSDGSNTITLKIAYKCS